MTNYDQNLDPVDESIDLENSNPEEEEDENNFDEVEYELQKRLDMNAVYSTSNPLYWLQKEKKLDQEMAELGIGSNDPRFMMYMRMQLECIRKRENCVE